MLSGLCLGAASIKTCNWCLEAIKLASEHVESVLNTKNHNISCLMDFVPWLPTQDYGFKGSKRCQGKASRDQISTLKTFHN